MKIKDCVRAPVIFPLVLYFLAHGLSLLNNGLYWDDWLWFNLDHALIFDAATEMGTSWGAHWGTYMMSLPHSILIYRVLIILCFMWSLWFVDSILLTLPLSPLDRFYIGCLYAVFPVNLFRLMPCLAAYALFNLCFFGAFYCLSRYCSLRRKGYYWLALGLFYLSFNLNSNLVFYSIPVLYYMYREKYWTRQFSWQEWTRLLGRFLRENPAMVLLPFLFWSIKVTWFAPQGIYAAYNRIEAPQLWKPPLQILWALYSSFFLAFDQIPRQLLLVWQDPLSKVSVVFIVVAFGAASLLGRRFLRFDNAAAAGAAETDRNLLIIGVIAAIAAVSPYVAIGQTPKPFSYSTRHQILLMLPCAFMTVLGIKIAVQAVLDDAAMRRKVRNAVTWALIVGFALQCVVANFQLIKDWMRQEAIHAHLEDRLELREATTVVFSESIPRAFSREILQYEYTGYLKRAYGDERRLGIGAWQFSGFENHLAYQGRYYQSRYLLSGYTRQFPIYFVDIAEAGAGQGILGTAKLLYSYWFDSADFKEEVAKLITLSVESVSFDEYVQRGWMHYEPGMPPQSFGQIGQNTDWEGKK